MEETLLYSLSMIQTLSNDVKETELGLERMMTFKAIAPYPFLDNYIFKNDCILTKHKVTFDDDLDSYEGMNRLILKMSQEIGFPITKDHLDDSNRDNIGFFNKLTKEFALVDYNRSTIIWETKYEDLIAISIPGDTFKTTFQKSNKGLDRDFFEGFFKCIDIYSTKENEYVECKILFPCPTCGKNHSTTIKTSYDPIVINSVSIIQGQAFSCECGTNFRTIEPYDLFEKF